MRRILRVRFALGNFENPYADPDAAAATVRKADFQQRADVAQRKSIVLLKNSNNLLPLAPAVKVYLEGLDAAIAARHGYAVVNRPEDADVCVVKVVPGRRAGAGGRGAPTGRERPGRGRGIGGVDTGGEPIVLTLPEDLLSPVRASMRLKPTVAAIHLDRPYVIPELAHEAAAVVATFGVTDAALFDVISGAFAPSGRLPFELPSSMDAVRAQKEDVPYDSRDPLFAHGAGLSYTRRPSMDARQQDR